MTLKNRSFINTITLLSILFLTLSCNTKSIVIKKENLSVSKVTLYEGDNKVYTENFLRFDFHSSLPPSDIDENSLFHLKASFIKNSKVVAKTSASGIFLTQNPSLDGYSEGQNYTAYVSRRLEVKLIDSQNVLSIADLEYDKLSFVVVDPTMAAGDKYRSNIIQYTKENISHLIANNSVKKVTLRY